MSLSATISGVGHWLPPWRVNTAQVEERVNRESTAFTLPTGLVELASGVSHRHYAEPPLNSADLAAFAAVAALEHAERLATDVDLLIFASASSALLEPATANLVQEQIACKNARVMDVKNACNSFVDALDVAATYVETGRYRCVLVAVGEVNSPTIRWSIADRQDMANCLAALTLGDAGAACVVEPADRADRGLLARFFASDGTQWRHSVVMSGGTIMRHDMSRLYLDCDTVELHRLGRALVPGAIAAAMQSASWVVDDIDLVVPHQVSNSAIDRICDIIGLDPVRCTRTLRHHGNTAAASIPLGLSLAKDDGLIRDGSNVLLVGASAGFSVGVIPVRWGGCGSI